MKFPLVWRIDYERAIIDRNNWQAAFARISYEYEAAKTEVAKLGLIVNKLESDVSSMVNLIKEKVQ